MPALDGLAGVSGVARSLLGALFALLLTACPNAPGEGAPRVGAAPDAGPTTDAGRAKDAGRPNAARSAAFVPVPGASAGVAWILSKRSGLLGIDANGKRTRVAIPDARVLDVATLTDGQTYVVETRGLRRVVGANAPKVHAFGERMTADLEDGANVLPGPNGAMSVLGAKRVWIGGKSGWKGTGRSAAVAVARDRAADLDDVGTPVLFGIDVDDELRVQNGDAWDPVAAVTPGLVVKNAVLAIAPAAGGVYVLREDGLYKLGARADAAASLVLARASSTGAAIVTSTSGVVALRDGDGTVTVISPVGEAVTLDAHIGAPFAVDDRGRVWFAADGELAVASPATSAAEPTKLAKTSDMTDLAEIAITLGGPPKEKLGR